VQIIAANQPELHEHSSEVAQLCRLVGSALMLPLDALEELARAAELHDVGKVGIPDAILAKEGDLTDAERAFVRQETVLGERILSSVPALRGVARIVRSTRERWDGRGYPDRLAGEAIPLAARIIAACDAYQTMRCDRADRPAKGREEVLDHMRGESGGQFDPEVVAALLKVVHDDCGRAGTREESRARAIYDALRAHEASARTSREVEDSLPPVQKLTSSKACAPASGGLGDF
jgi:HD-GYP domain-containing protein (c-di-GMP phosphodiesterase class II)